MSKSSKTNNTNRVHPRFNRIILIENGILSVLRGCRGIREERVYKVLPYKNFTLRLDIIWRKIVYTSKFYIYLTINWFYKAVVHIDFCINISI